MSSCPRGPLNARIKEGIVGNGVAVTVSTHITESPYSSCTHTFGYPTFRGSKRGIHYGRIRLPDAAGGPFPIVINFHGGFWKSEWSLERHGPSTAALLAAFGTTDVASWDVEYARVDQSDPTSSEAGGGWPHTCLDALAALNALALPGVLASGIRTAIDLSRVYLCGHSAGGHLALWTACLSRLPPPELERVGAAVEALAGAEAGAAARAGVHADITVVGVVGLAPVTSLRAAAADGLSDHHDAVPNFLWRAGATAAATDAGGHLDAACPLALFRAVPAAAGPLAQMRVLLVHGLADEAVPPSMSASLAAALGPEACRLVLMPALDHFVVAAIDVDPTNEKGGTRSNEWARVAAVLRAFVVGDDAALDAACVATADDAAALLKDAVEPVCARRTLASEPAERPEETTRGLARWSKWSEA